MGGEVFIATPTPQALTDAKAGNICRANSLYMSHLAGNEPAMRREALVN
jgi:hypothetical protein